MTEKTTSKLQRIRRVATLVFFLICGLAFVGSIIAIGKSGLWGFALLILCVYLLVPALLLLLMILQTLCTYFLYKNNPSFFLRAELATYVLSAFLSAVALICGILVSFSPSSNQDIRVVVLFYALAVVLLCAVVRFILKLIQKTGDTK